MESFLRWTRHKNVSGTELTEPRVLGELPFGVAQFGGYRMVRRKATSGMQQNVLEVVEDQTKFIRSSADKLTWVIIFSGYMITTEIYSLDFD